MKIYKNNIKAAVPFITKDSSIIRSIIDSTNARVKNVTLAEAVVKKGKSTLSHIHRRSEEIYYFLEGSGTMVLDKNKIRVAKGDAVLIPPGTAHKLINNGKADMKLLCACAPPYSDEDSFMQENAFKLVIFDFDGTLVDSATGIWHTANAMAARFGVWPFRRQQIVDAVGTGLDNFISDLFPKQVKEFGMDTMIKVYRQIYDVKYKNGLKMFKNVKKTLRYLYARGLKLAIVSNKLKRYVVEINKEIGINEYFDITLGSENVKKRKPHPAPVHQLMKRYNLKKEDVLLVGDSEYDIEAGKNAGVVTAYMEYGYADKKKIAKLKPDFVLSDFGKLQEIV